MDHGQSTDSTGPTSIARVDGGRFAPGLSANPRGRPAVAVWPPPRQLAQRLDQIADAEGEALLRKVLDMAHAGDPAALDLVFRRIWPQRRGRPGTPFTLPVLEDASSVSAALAATAQAVAQGIISTDEATQIGNLIELFAKSLRLGDIERRLIATEQSNQNGSG